MQTSLFDSQGREYQEDSAEIRPHRPQLEEIETAFFTSLECYVGSHESRLEALCFLRIQLHRDGRAEQFYGYFIEDGDGGFEQILSGLREQIEQRWGKHLVLGGDDGRTAELLSSVAGEPPSRLPGNSGIHDQIRYACMENLQTVVEVPDLRTAVTLLKSYYKRDGREFAVAREMREEIYGGANVVFIVTGSGDVKLRSKASRQK